MYLFTKEALFKLPYLQEALEFMFVRRIDSFKKAPKISNLITDLVNKDKKAFDELIHYTFFDVSDV